MMCHFNHLTGLESGILVSLLNTLPKLPSRESSEVKYRGSEHTEPRDVMGLLAFCAEQEVAHAYVITRDVTDFRVMDVERAGVKVRLVNVPAPLACFWLGRSELEVPSDAP